MIVRIFYDSLILIFLQRGRKTVGFNAIFLCICTDRSLQKMSAALISTTPKLSCFQRFLDPLDPFVPSFLRNLSGFEGTLDWHWTAWIDSLSYSSSHLTSSGWVYCSRWPPALWPPIANELNACATAYLLSIVWATLPLPSIILFFFYC